MNKLALAALAIPALVVGLAGCTASNGSDGSATKTPTVSAADWQAQFAECLRSGGVEITDPSSGGVEIGGGADKVDFSQVSDSCERSVTKKLGKPPVADSPEQLDAEERAKDDCLRSAGVEVPEDGPTNLTGVPKDVIEKCGLVEAGGAQ